MTSGDLSLERVSDEEQVAQLVSHVFAEPETRRGMGWTEEDDPEEAMEAIAGLWEARFAEGWRIYAVQQGQATVGLAGLGPAGEDSPWWAVYLLERGQGLGKTAGQRLIEQARREGAKQVLAVTWRKNEASRGMLEALGFHEVGPAPYDWARESELSWLQYRRELG